MQKPYVVAWTFQVVLYILQRLLLRFNCEPWQYILPPVWWLCCPSFGLCYLLYYKLAKCRILMLLHGQNMTFQVVFYRLQRLLLRFNCEPWQYILPPDWWLCRQSFRLYYLLFYKLAQSRSLILLRGKTLVLQAVFYLCPDMILLYNFLPWIQLFDHYSLSHLLKGRGLNTFVYKPQFSDRLIGSHLNSVWTKLTIARQL